MLVVEDTGIGISDKDQERIFDVFTQPSEQRIEKYGGTGLGLAITKRLTELMNGNIEVSSHKGQGSIFRVILKQIPVSYLEKQIERDSAIDFNEISFDKQKVLIADDIESNRNLLSEVLSKLNLECLIAENGEEALLIAIEKTPDLIIMDIRMPIMNGYEAMQKLKENPKTKQIPVIAFTASATENDKTKGLKYGFTNFLSKPIKMDILVNELSKYFEPDKSDKIHQNSVSLNKITNTDNIDRPEELMLKLKNEILPRFHAQKRAMVMEDISKFSELLRTTGERHNVQNLIEYSIDLDNDISLFNVSAIEKKFKTFQNDIDTFLKIIGKADA